LDIFNSIKLSATGGDQVVKEIKKIKDAFDDAAGAGDAVGTKVSAPVTKPGAQQQDLGLWGRIRDFFSRREKENADRVRDKTKEGAEASEKQSARAKDNEERRNRAEERNRKNLGQKVGGVAEGGARAGAGFIDPLSGDRADALRAWSGLSSRAGELAKEYSHRAAEKATERAKTTSDTKGLGETAKETKETGTEEAPREPGRVPRFSRLRNVFRRRKPAEDAAPADEGTPDTPAGGSSDNAAPMKSLSGGLKAMAPAAMGVVGGVLAAGGVVMSVISTLAHKEIERASMLWSSGISQRLTGGPGGMGSNYSRLRRQYLDYGAEGIPQGSITSFYGALGSSGGGWTGARTGQGLNVRNALATSAYYGVEAGALGRAIGIRQQAGLSNNPDYMLGTTALPQGLMTKYVTVVSGAVEEGMKRGMNKGALESFTSGTATLMNAVMSAQGGNKAYGTAEALVSGIQSHYSGGSQLSSGKEVMQFLRMRKPGEDFLETMERVRNPTEALKSDLSWIKQASGGNKTLMRNMAAGVFGELAPGLNTTLIDSAGAFMGDTKMKERGRGFVGIGALRGDRGAAVIQTSQTKILAEAESSMVNVMSKVNNATLALVNAFSDGTPSVKKIAAALDKIDLKTDVKTKVPTGKGKKK